MEVVNGKVRSVQFFVFCLLAFACWNNLSSIVIDLTRFLLLLLLLLLLLTELLYFASTAFNVTVAA